MTDEESTEDADLRYAGLCLSGGLVALFVAFGLRSSSNDTVAAVGQGILILGILALIYGVLWGGRVLVRRLVPK